MDAEDEAREAAAKAAEMSLPLDVVAAAMLDGKTKVGDQVLGRVSYNRILDSVYSDQFRSLLQQMERRGEFGDGEGMTVTGFTK